jgi:hypothetical protein
VYPSYSATSLQLHNKKLELLNVEREILRDVKRMEKALRDLEYELYMRKNKELIVERQVNNPTLDIYV